MRCLCSAKVMHGCLLLCTGALTILHSVPLMGKKTRQILLCSVFPTVPAVSVVEPDTQPALRVFSVLYK